MFFQRAGVHSESARVRDCQSWNMWELHLEQEFGIFSSATESHEDGGTNTDLICFLSHCGDCVRGREERRQKWMLGSW